MPDPAQSTLEPVTTGPQNSGASGAAIRFGGAIAPGFESLPNPGEETTPVGPDGWYDVDTSGQRAGPGSSVAEPLSPSSLASPTTWNTTQNWVILGIGLVGLLLAAFLTVMFRRNRSTGEAELVPGARLTAGVRNSMDNQMPSILQDAPDRAEPNRKSSKAEQAPQPAAEPVSEPQLIPRDKTEARSRPEPEPPVAASASPTIGPADGSGEEPSWLDPNLEIVSASRSFMMFSIDFRLDIANRSDKALRALHVTTALACAQSARSDMKVLTDGQQLQTIDRIGPQQSARIAGQMQLPLAQFKAISQGTKPLFIPLMHVKLEGSDRLASSYSFVIGTPSATSTGRVHPLPLDGPPGSLPLLRAQLIQHNTAADATV
ncbi:MAG: hypothetical protein AAF697_07450 [Pseudomonadota bacterium]